MKDRRKPEDRVRPLPSQEELNRILSYNPATGVLLWKHRARSDFPSEQSYRSWNNRFVGEVALNSVSTGGYLCGRVFGHVVNTHRAIWKMVSGSDPLLIDHVNGDRADNRIINLRDVTRLENGMNCKVYANNKSGTPGVFWDKSKGKWIAYIDVMGKRKRLGSFKTIEEAKSVRETAQADLGFHENHGRN